MGPISEASPRQCLEPCVERKPSEGQCRTRDSRRPLRKQSPKGNDVETKALTRGPWAAKRPMCPRSLTEASRKCGHTDSRRNNVETKAHGEQCRNKGSARGPWAAKHPMCPRSLTEASRKCGHKGSGRTMRAQGLQENNAEPKTQEEPCGNKASRRTM